MPTRREARERALSLCYEADVRGLDAEQLLGELPAPPDEYAEAVVRGVGSHRDGVDAILRKVSEHWALERMPLVDRAGLRPGCYAPGREGARPARAVTSQAPQPGRPMPIK